MRIGIALFTFALFSACGGGRNPDQEVSRVVGQSLSISGLPYDIVSGSTSLSGAGLIGNGIIRFAEPFMKAESAHHFVLRFSLAENASLTLLANARQDLTGGVEIEMRRSAQGKLIVTARAGNDSIDLSPHFDAIDVNKEISLSFDIHNDHGASVHLVAWGTQELFEDILRGRGFGSFWGLKLTEAQVHEVRIAAPKAKH